MLLINIQISIITLIKNDNLKFLKTLKSIKSQEREFDFEWIIIDGSNQKNQIKNKNHIKKYTKFYYMSSRQHFSINRL